MTRSRAEGWSRGGVPLGVWVVSALALALPVAVTVLWPTAATSGAGALVWLPAVVPPFLLAYHGGWRGAFFALGAALVVTAVAGGVVVLTSGPSPPAPFLILLAGAYGLTCLAAGFLADVIARERRRAEELALVDATTGLANRRHAGLILDSAFSAAARGRPVSVVVFVVDRFDDVVGRSGGEAGQVLLRDVGEILRSGSRRMDLPARWGEREFISILMNCHAPGALRFAARIRAEVRSQEYPWGSVTLSAGIAEFELGMGNSEVLVAAADRALRQAREEGEDRCLIATGSGGATRGLESGEAELRRGVGRPDRELRRILVGLDSPPAILPWEGARIDDEGSSALLGLPGGRERILFVDDDEPARDVVGRLLARLGYRVTLAADAESAIELVRAEESFDLLVTDLILPGMSGFALTDSIVREFGPIRVLYVSGQVREGMVWWSGVPGAKAGFLEKPMAIEELAVQVRELLDFEPPAAPEAIGSAQPPT